MTDHSLENQTARKVGFVGTFDVANYGDCLFPLVYMHLLEKTVAGLEFSFYSPFARSAEIMEYGPIKALPEKLSDIAFNEDALILCGGETLWFGHSSGTFNFPASTLSAYTRLWLAPSVAAARGEVDFYVHSVGMPRPDLAAPREVGDALSAATKVTVRDEVTARRLYNRFPVEVDPVFALSTMKELSGWEDEARRWLPEGYKIGRYLAAHISLPYLVDGLPPWCDEIAEVARRYDLPVLLVPVCHFMDDRNTLEAARAILIDKGIAEKRVCVAPMASKDVTATAAMLGMSAGIITSSLHACVTAVSFGLPFASFVGNGKADGKHQQTLLAAGVDYGMAMGITDLAMTFDNSSGQDCSERKVAAIERALSGFEPLTQGVQLDQRSARQLSSKTIDAVLLHDTAPTRNLRLELKRTILRWVNKSELLASLLLARRRSRIWRDAA